VIRDRALAAGALSALAACAIAGCGGVSKRRTAHAPSARAASIPAATERPSRPRPAPPSYPRLTSGPATEPTRGFVPIVSWHGQTASWVARTASGIALLSFDQRLLQLHLHSGTVDAGSTGWRFGPSVAGVERKQLVAAFNGGFKLSTGAGGFESDGRVAVPPRDGLGSIVTYADGSTDIGSWHREVPSSGRPVVSVRQNLALLIDRGSVASTLDCVSCWGATLGGVSDPARSALGITADGRLIWAGGEHLTVTALADALLGARVVRAVELDINPEWVAAYLYGHRGGRGPLAPVPVVPGQPGVPGQFLTPWSRDFFTIVAR
jgi:hypothetical protein